MEYYGVVYYTPEGTFKEVVADAAHACAIGFDDQIECWGAQHSTGAYDALLLKPEGAYFQIDAGESATCAIRLP